MRHSISGLLVVFAAVTVSAAPAMACGRGPFTSDCSPCAQAYVSPCGEVYGYGYGVVAYERLPDPSPQYFYVNQGPAYSGPGNFAPVPVYQEAAVSGWNAYERGYYYGYDGGRYANAVHHHYDGQPAWGGPAIYSYRSHPHHRGYYAPRYAYSFRHHRMHYGIPRYYAAPRYGTSRHLRRYY